MLFAYPEPESSKPIDLKNEFSFAKLEMPIVDASNILQGLEKIKIAMEEMRQDPEKHVSKRTYCILEVFKCIFV